MSNVQRTFRTTDAYGRLKEEIRTNQFQPGSLVPEPEIANRLGMSRTPVREALIRLQSEGLVELIPRRGARILPIKADDMREIYEILTALEPDVAAKLAARKISDVEISPLDNATAEMESALDASDLDQWAAADDRFHQNLLKIHGNQRLIGFVNSLYDQVHRARIVTLRLREWPIKSTEEHRFILECLRKGDSQATWQAFRSHRVRTMNELLNILENYRLPQL